MLTLIFIYTRIPIGIPHEFHGIPGPSFPVYSLESLKRSDRTKELTLSIEIFSYEFADFLARAKTLEKLYIRFTDPIEYTGPTENLPQPDSKFRYYISPILNAHPSLRSVKIRPGIFTSMRWVSVLIAQIHGLEELCIVNEDRIIKGSWMNPVFEHCENLKRLNINVRGFLVRSSVLFILFTGLTCLVQ